MNSQRYLSASVVGLLLCGAACEQEATTTTAIAATITPGASVAGRQLGVFEAYWPQRSSTELAGRLASVSGIILGSKTPDLATFSAAVAGQTTSAPQWTAALSSQGSQVHVEYFPGRDDLRVSNRDVEGDFSTDTDVGETVARATATSVLAGLGAANVINSANYDMSKATVSHVMHGSTVSTSQPAPQILEYRFSVRRQINGIDFAHNGITIAVHRNGKVASIRLGGAEIRSTGSGGAEQPTGKGSVFTAQVATSDVNARFANEHSDARGVKSRLMYVFPDGEDSGIIEPRQVVLYSRPHAGAAGAQTGAKVALSKGRYLAYSLRGQSDAPKYISGVPVPAANPDTITR